MRHLAGVLAGPGVIGRVRAALLVAVAVAALADLTTYAALVTADDDASGGPSAAPEPPGPEDVARTVVQAVADEDCSGLDGLLADGAVVPYTVTACLDGAPGGASLDDVRVVGTTAEGGTAAVTFAVVADGQDAEVVVALARAGERWQVTGITAG